MTEKYVIEVAKRPWFEWLLWTVWLALEVFLLQNAMASGGELEPLASTIFWISFFVLLVGGLVVYYLRRNSK